jgi:succinoglycan biosynthesis protein ExoV
VEKMKNDLGIYYWDVHHNFGDLINPWLWPKYFPELTFFDSAKRKDGVFEALNDELVVGIGSLLNERFPIAKKTYVIGAGVGYGKPRSFDDSVKVYCVRGPKSAEILGLDKSMGIIDPGVLVNKFITKNDEKRYKFSYMPQITSVVKCSGVWEQICKDLSFGYLDPLHSVDETLKRVQQTEVLLTESMHGAIIAEALRVPWIPIVTRQEILSFKWQDWCESVNLEYSPTQISPIYEPWKSSFLRDIKGKISHSKAKAELKKASMVKPVMGNESILNGKISQLDDRLMTFKQDMLTRGL